MQIKRQRTYYTVTDYISANLAWLIFNIVRFYTLAPYYPSQTLDRFLLYPYVITGQIIFPLMMVVLYALSGYYNSVFFKSRLDDVLNSASNSLIGVVIIFFTTLYNDPIEDRLGNLEICLILWTLFTLFTFVPRLLITAWAKRKIINREISFDALIVGTSTQAVKLAKDLDEKHKNMGFKIIGFVSTDKGSQARSSLPTIHIDQIVEVCREKNVKSIIIVPNHEDTTSTIHTINRLLPLGVDVYLTPDYYSLIAARPRTSMVAGQVLIDISKAPIPPSTANLKRIGDIVVSSLALIALLPVFGILAIMIKRDSKGPVLYKQERIGYKKRPFNIYKFRSMYTDSEADGPALSSANDPRITPLGRILRKYRLDELPQFWNVLKGDMSLVGPRPERAYYLEQIIKRAPYYNIMHQVRPGITSWGMVKYGYASNVDQMLQRMKFDLLYIENVSLSVDMKILFYTINTVITGRGV